MGGTLKKGVENVELEFKRLCGPWKSFGMKKITEFGGIDKVFQGLGVEKGKNQVKLSYRNIYMYREGVKGNVRDKARSEKPRIE